MSWFKDEHKKSVQVIKVRHTTRKKVEYRSGTSYHQRYDDRTEQEVDVTEILCVVNGELCVKEFNGKWDLENIKKGLE